MSEQIKYVLLFEENGTSVLSKIERSGVAAFERIDKEQDGFRRATRKSTKEVSKLDKEITGLKGSAGIFRTLGVAAGGFLALSSFKRIGQDIVETTAKYERFEAVLGNTLQSNSRAKTVMRDIQMFASRTPFQVDELTGSFVKMANQGFEPNIHQMTMLGDLAASTGKSYDQLTEALLDAQVGEFERLKEFGIRANKQGDRVKFTFKGVTKEVGFQDKAIRDYLMSLGSISGVTGAMNKISKTTGGLLSNMGDNLDRLSKSFGDRLKPQIHDSIGLMASFTNKIIDWIEVSASERLRDEQAEINNLVDSILSLNEESSVRDQLLDELMQKYPDYFSNIDKEKGLQEQLKNTLIKVNEQYEKRIQLAAFEESVTDLEKRRQVIRNYSTSVVKAINKSYKDVVSNPVEGATTEEKIAAIQREGGLISRREAKIYGNSLKDWKQKEKAINDEISDINIDKEAFTKRFNLGADDSGSNTGGSTSTSTGGSKSGLGSGIGSIISGGVGPKNITINIEKLIEKSEIHTTNIDQGFDQLEDRLKEVLMTAINDGQIAAN